MMGEAVGPKGGFWICVDEEVAARAALSKEDASRCC